MVYFEDFLGQVKAEFGFLINKGYSEKTFTKTQYSYNFFYLKDNVGIKIHYSLRNENFEVIFYKESHLENGDLQDETKSLDLTYYFAARSYPLIFYDAIMPKIIGFESSVKALAYIVRTIASEIIDDKDWITNKMVVDGFKYDP
jgi:hypothetical protein